MAENWIKVEKSTARKPEVMRLATILGIHPDYAYGLCFRFWCWCDDNLSSSVMVGMNLEHLDTLMGHSGFASALVSVGWLQAREGSLAVPNFNRHLSQSAKSRALAARRQERYRAKNSNAPSVTKTSPEERRGEERRKEERLVGGGNTPPRPPVLPLAETDHGGSGIAEVGVIAYQTRRYRVPDRQAQYYAVVLQEARNVFGSGDDARVRLDRFLAECQSTRLPSDASFSDIAKACGLKKSKSKIAAQPSPHKDYTAERLAKQMAIDPV